MIGVHSCYLANTYIEMEFTTKVKFLNTLIIFKLGRRKAGKNAQLLAKWCSKFCWKHYFRQKFKTKNSKSSNIFYVGTVMFKTFFIWFFSRWITSILVKIYKTCPTTLFRWFFFLPLLIEMISCTDHSKSSLVLADVDIAQCSKITKIVHKMCVQEVASWFQLPQSKL